MTKLDWNKLLTKENLVVVILVGVLLFVVSVPVNKKQESGVSPKTESENDVTWEDYAQACERELTDLLSKVKGVGSVKVMITLKGSEEKVYYGNGNFGDPYVTKTLEPEVAGVVVVAKGGGQGRIDRTVTEIVQALFGLEAHKVKVVSMRE